MTTDSEISPSISLTSETEYFSMAGRSTVVISTVVLLALLCVLAVLFFTSQGQQFVNGVIAHESNHRGREPYSLARFIVACVVLPIAVWLGLVNAATTVVTLSPQGIALKRFGITLWRIPWSLYNGWWHESGSRGEMAVIWFPLKNGQRRRLGLKLLFAPQSRCQAMLAGLQRFHPEPGEVPPDLHFLRTHARGINTIVMALITVILLIAISVVGWAWKHYNF